MKKNNMTDEEIAKLKEELKKELMVEMANEKENKKTVVKTSTKNSVSKTASKPKAKVDSTKPTKLAKNNIATKTVRVKKEEIKNEVLNSNEEKASPILLVIIPLLIALAIFVLPKVYNHFSKDVKQDKIIEDNNNKEEVKETITYSFDDEIVKELPYPIMRNNVHSLVSYYQVDSITMSEFANNDILYNAFLDVYSGNIATYTEGYDGAFCGTNEMKKTFNAKYIDARINNLFTKNTVYTHSDFVVPDSAETIYKGLWKYDAVNNRYIYYGKCSIVEYTPESYYDILIPEKISNTEDGETIYIEYKIGFVKELNGNYEVYSDPNYANLIKSGVKETEIDFKELLKDLDLNTYKYTFSKEDCAYSDFCFVSGEFLK